MQRLKKCVGIDIGVSAVKVVEVSVEKKGIRVGRCVQAEIATGADGDRAAVVTKALKGIFAAHKGLPRSAVFSLPGQNVFIRRLQVPRTTEERLQKIISYEARQQIPFSLDTAVVEYQISDDENKPEVDVLLAAVKKDVVNEYMKIVAKSGLKPVAISVSSLALFNFNAIEGVGRDFVEECLVGPAKKGKKGAGGGFDLMALFGKKKGISGAKGLAAVLEDDAEEQPDDMPFEEVKAFINVGAQTFDLAVARMSKVPHLGFVRSVATAGNDLTRSLQDKMRLESAALAEEIKRTRSIVIIPGLEHEAEAEGVSKEASEFSTIWADRLISDIRRSFDYFISQPEGMAVDSIVLGGGAAQMTNLAPYIEDRLGIPVEYKQEIVCEAVDAGKSIEGPIGVYQVALGLAYCGLGLGLITVDFLPQDLKNLRNFKRKNLEAGAMVGCIGGMIFLSSMAGNDQMEAMERWLQQNETSIARVNRTRQESEKAQMERTALNDQVNKVGDAVGDRLFWLEFLGALETAKPPDILITRIGMEPNGRVQLIGETEVLSSFRIFIERLRASDMAEWVESVTTVQVPSPTISRFMGKEVQRFELAIKVKGKETRLAFVRQTFAPGHLTPTPAPAGPAPVRPGGGQGRGAQEDLF